MGPELCWRGNGLDALALTFRAWKELGKLKDGDEVIVPANTYIASILAITESRLKPVLVELDEKTYNLCPGNVADAITPKTKGHGQFGCLSPMAVDFASEEHIFARGFCTSSRRSACRKEGWLLSCICFQFLSGKTWSFRGYGAVTLTMKSCRQLFGHWEIMGAR